MKNLENRLSEIRRDIKNENYSSERELSDLICEREFLIRSSKSKNISKSTTEIISLMNQHTF